MVHKIESLGGRNLVECDPETCINCLQDKIERLELLLDELPDKIGNELYNKGFRATGSCRYISKQVYFIIEKEKQSLCQTKKK
mgnify:CR=1 FL=1